MKTRVSVVLMLAAVVSLAALTTSASAARRHTISYNPPTFICDQSAPHVGGGTYITNAPCGFYLGRAWVGWTFDLNSTSGEGFHYGRTYGSANRCGYIEPSTLNATYTIVADTCSETTRQNLLYHSSTFGRNFNCPFNADGRSSCLGGTNVNVTGSCNRQFHYNYYNGAWNNYAGQEPNAQVQYRFTTADGAAAVVRSFQFGWGFLPANCVSYAGYPGT